MLNQVEQQLALKLARQTLEYYFNPKKIIEKEYKNYSVFQKNRGVFVTLNKNKKLRGCVGLIEPPAISLGEAIQQMALAAAFDDYRFPALKKSELAEIKIEISVLTVPKKVNQIEQIQLGQHGVIVKSGFKSGVFLPQVATETGWSKEKFLSELCSQKAGLSADCWQDPAVHFFVFGAQVFKE